MEKYAIYSNTTEFVPIDVQTFDKQAFFLHIDESDPKKINEIENGAAFRDYVNSTFDEMPDKINFLQNLLKFCFDRTFSFRTTDSVKTFDDILVFVNDHLCNDHNNGWLFIWSGIELYILTKISFFFFHRSLVPTSYFSNAPNAPAKNAHFALLFNLPPGFGKTFQNCLLADEFGAKVACPTAKAAFLYTNESGANTIHSAYRISPFGGGRQKWSTSPQKKVNLPMSKFCIFDECFMTGHKLFSQAVEKVFQKSFFLLTGDTAQMPPVAATAPDFDKIFPHKLIKFCIDYTPSPYMVIPRFANAPKLQQFILRLKRFIDNNNNEQSEELTDKVVREWFDYLRIFNIQEEIDPKKMIDKIIEQQNQQNDFIDEDTLDKLSVNYAIVGFFNKYSENIIQQVLHRADFSNVSWPQNYGVDIMEEVEPIKSNMSGVVMSEAMFKRYNSEPRFRGLVSGYLNRLPGTIVSSSNKMYTGTYVICRKNMVDYDLDKVNGEKLFNGQVGYITNQDWSKVKTIPLSKGEFAVTNQDIEEFCKSVVFSVYLMDKKKVIDVHYQLVCICQNCVDNTCVHATNDKHKKEFSIAVCFWHVNYALTIYNLQGVTLKDVNVLFQTGELLKRHVLKTIYTLASRTMNPKQLSVDKSFFLSFFQKIASPNEKLSLGRTKILYAKILSLF